MSNELPPLPKVRVDDTNLQRLLDGLTLIIRQWNGDMGVEKQLVSVNDFLSDTNVSGTVNADDSGTGIDTGSGSGSSETDLSAPSDLSALSVTEVITGVVLQWSDAGVGNYSYTEIWRHTSDVLGSATLIGTSIPPIYADMVGDTDTAYYYWVRPVSVENVPGAYNATPGTTATTQKVTANDITVLNLAAISANLGSITAGDISINNKFIVDSSGNTTIQSAATGERLVIKNNVIQVFDSTGTKRVQLGDLSVA